MKVFHIESGLGNQMLDYADLIASRSMNPNEKYYIETIIYDIPQNRIKMWNGYELENIFGIHETNVKTLFSDDEWKCIINDVCKSEFWNTYWSYTDAITKAFAKQGLALHDIHPRHPQIEPSYDIYKDVKQISHGKYLLKRFLMNVFESKIENSVNRSSSLFRKSDKDDYDGHYLSFKYKNNKIEWIEKELRACFKFPQYDERNKTFSHFLKNCESVAIHARRSDMLGTNSFCYEYGYFSRAVKYIKKAINNPVFVFFCDPGSITWCKENYKVFGLTPQKDSIHFVDWNSGDECYRDMQLMADCKHNIITTSTFGWWSAFLNSNPNKITCSPDCRFNTTKWF